MAIISQACRRVVSRVYRRHCLWPAAGLTWRLATHFRLDGAVFLITALTHPAPDSVGDETRLPNVPAVSARGAVLLELPVTETLDVELRSQLAYIGQSSLGIEPALALDQGDYLLADLGARFGDGTWSIGADLTNLFDVRGNRFAMGNPFEVADGRQITPERPRTIRLTVSFGF